MHFFNSPVTTSYLSSMVNSPAMPPRGRMYRAFPRFGTKKKRTGFRKPIPEIAYIYITAELPKSKRLSQSK